MDRRDCPPHPSPTQHIAEQGVIASKRRLTLAFGFGLPTELSQEAVMQVGTAIVVSIGAVVTDRTPEQLATLPPHPLPTRNREPLAFGSTAATLLTGSPRIDLNRDYTLGIQYRELLTKNDISSC